MIKMIKKMKFTAKAVSGKRTLSWTVQTIDGLVYHYTDKNQFDQHLKADQAEKLLMEVDEDFAMLVRENCEFTRFLLFFKNYSQDEIVEIVSQGETQTIESLAEENRLFGKHLTNMGYSHRAISDIANGCFADVA